MSTLIGIDLQSIDEVEASLATFGERYERRLFTPLEIAECSGSPRRATRFATHFAAKEAMMKVLDVHDLVPPWTTIEVRDDRENGPSVSLSGAAAELARLGGITGWRLSMSNDGGVAIATVIAERTQDIDGANSERS